MHFCNSVKKQTVWYTAPANHSVKKKITNPGVVEFFQLFLAVLKILNQRVLHQRQMEPTSGQRKSKTSHFPLSPVVCVCLCFYSTVGELAGLALSSRAAMRSFKWSCSLSLDSVRRRSTVSDKRLLCSSFIFSLCRA